MSDEHRYRRPAHSQLSGPVDSATVIDIGDLLYWDSNDLKPASSQADQGTEAANQRLFASKFAGVSADKSRSGDTKDAAFATCGEFECDCPSGTWEIGDLFAADENGTGDALLDQTVTKVTDVALAIGVCTKRVTAASTKVTGRLFSRVAGELSLNAGNKFTSPEITTGLQDANGNEALDLPATASAVNQVLARNAATGTAPRVEAAGDDANVDLELKPKGSGNVTVLDGNGNEVIKTAEVASAVNEITAANAATGNGVSLSATGGDTNIAFTIAGEGTGAVNLGQATSVGVDLVATQPIRDANANELVEFTATGSAINNIKTVNAAAGGTPTLEASGGDTNIGLAVKGKGTGSVDLGQSTSTGVKLVADQPLLDSAGLELLKFTTAATAVNEVTVANAATGNPPAISATGGDTNIGLNVVGKGTGAVQVGQATGSVEIATAISDLVGFYGVTAVDQPVTVTDPAGGGTIDAEARTAINAIIDRLQELGLIA